MIERVHGIQNLVIENAKWMGWNLFLAFIPLIIALILFNKDFWKGPFLNKIVTFIVFLIFYFFLPNAPYVLSDVIHLIRQIRDFRYFRINDNQIILILIPQYILFFFLGFSCYVLAFQKFLHWLLEIEFLKIEISNFIITIIKIVNPFIMSIGIFLGRYYRFNSWDLISKYDRIINKTLEHFNRIDFLVFVFITSITIFVGFEILSIFYRSIFKKMFE